jgi:predicted lipid-binding transport protein (Tim44 family)
MIDIIIFAAFAVFIGFKLFNALGRKDFDNPKRAAQDNVVRFPAGNNDKAVDVKFEEIKDDYEELEKKHGLEIANQIKEIRKFDSGFNEKDFLAGAKRAFEMILQAFAKGDKETLKPLLASNIYEGFKAEIDKRELNGEVEETTLVAVLTSEIKDIKMTSKWNARIVVEIVSEQIRLVKDKEGRILQGDPSHVDKVSEIWTFSRNLTSPNPNWELVETGHVSD